jgi:dipeptidyl aminopeptidase/acylaminoacyl peptidase/Flp pilus assembly protein TadD
VAFSPDGKRLASAGEDSTVRLRDIATGEPALTLQGHTGWVTRVAWSPDGKRLASAGKDGTVRLWDAATGKPVRALRGHTGPVWSVAWSPDGKRLASAGDDGTVRLWDAASGQEAFTFRGHTGLVGSVAWSPDGKRLASAGLDGTVRLWDAAGAQQPLAIKGHKGLVASLAWSPDGKRLASAGHDGIVGTVRLWDPATGLEALTLKWDDGSMGVNSVAFSPDGKRLASAAFMVKVWECSVSAEDLVRREIVRLVGDRFDTLGLQAKVLAGLRKDPTLSAAERAFALQVARASREDHWRLNGAAWGTVKAEGRRAEAYALALKQAQAAVRGEPGNGEYWSTLGVAYYRLTEYAKALEVLTQSEKLNATKDGSEPTDLAFQAMARHQLGQKELAQSILRRLREVMRQPRWVNDAERQGFVREAEEVLRSERKNPGK